MREGFALCCRSPSLRQNKTLSQNTQNTFRTKHAVLDQVFWLLIFKLLVLVFALPKAGRLLHGASIWQAFFLLQNEAYPGSLYFIVEAYELTGSTFFYLETVTFQMMKLL